MGALNKKLLVIGVYISLLFAPYIASAEMSSDDFESILINWGDSFAELAGTRQKSVENDVGGCLINGGDWVVEDIRGKSGEYCIDHETLEPFQVAKGDAPLHVIPDTKSLMLRYQWIAWMFSSWDHIYSHPMDVFDDTHEINAVYNQESALLKNDEHLAVYWLLHFYFLMDPRFDALNDSLSDNESELVQAARMFLNNATRYSNFSVSDENPNLFLERRARAIYAVSYDQAGTIKQLLNSWRIDSHYIGSAQAYRLVQLAEASKLSSWVLREVESSSPDKVGAAYIRLMLGKNSKKSKSLLRAQVLNELEDHHDRWANHGAAKNILSELVNEASVEQLERVVDLYYSVESLDADYFELKRTIQTRGGLGLATSRFGEVDLNEVDRILSIHYFNGGQQQFLQAFVKLDTLSQEALLQKAKIQGVKFDENTLFKALWTDNSGGKKEILTTLIEHYNFMGEDQLAVLVGDSNPTTIRQFLAPQRQLLIELFRVHLEEFQQLFPLYDDERLSEFKGDVLNALSFFNTDDSINTMILNTLTASNRTFSLKESIYKNYLGVTAEEYLAIGDDLSHKENRLWQKGMMHRANALPLSDDEKYSLTELVKNLLTDGTDSGHEHAINDIFQVLRSLDTQATDNAIVELVLNAGYNEVSVAEKMTAQFYETLRVTKSFYQLENYSLFLANPAIDVNTDLQEVDLMSEVLSWKLRLKTLDRGELLTLHDVLLTGIERGLAVGVVNDLPTAFKTVKKVESRIKKLDKKELKSGENFLELLSKEGYTTIDDYFLGSYLTEQYEALASGKTRKRLATLNNTPPKKLSDVDNSVLSTLSGKQVNKRVWQSDTSALFVDQDNAIHFLSLDDRHPVPFTSHSFLKHSGGFTPLTKAEWRRHTTIWKDSEGDFVEWIWLGTRRLLLFATNTIDASSGYDDCDINKTYCFEDYGVELEELESLPIRSQYMGASRPDVPLRSANILAFESAESAVTFYSELGKHKPGGYDVIDPWYVKGQGQISRRYQTSFKPGPDEELVHNASALYYREPQQELQSALVGREQRAFKKGIARLNYAIKSSSQLRSEDATLYHVLHPLFAFDPPNSEAFAEWAEAFTHLEDVLSFGGVHALYPELNTVRLKVGSPVNVVSLKTLEDSTGIPIPEKIRAIWQQAADISLLQENGLEFQLYNPSEVSDQTLPERVWLRNTLSEFDDSERDKALRFFNKCWLFMRVRNAYDERYYFYEPVENQVLVFNKRTALADLDERYSMDAFSPADIDLRVPEILRSIPVDAEPIVESEQFFLVGDENEVGDKMYLSFSADLANNVLSMRSNIPSLDGDHMTYRYPTRHALVNDRNILERNFKALGMVRTTQPPVLE